MGSTNISHFWSWRAQDLAASAFALLALLYPTPCTAHIYEQYFEALAEDGEEEKHRRSRKPDNLRWPIHSFHWPS